MPLYEYACGKCNTQFEILVRGGDSPQCPECGTQQIEKQLSVPAAHVQGNGNLPMCDLPPKAGPCGMGGCGLPECG